MNVVFGPYILSEWSYYQFINLVLEHINHAVIFFGNQWLRRLLGFDSIAVSAKLHVRDQLAALPRTPVA